MTLAKGRSILRQVLAGLFLSSVDRERQFYRRYRELSDKIDEMPDSVTYYVLRGEFLVKRGDFERARADFQTAVELADSVDPSQGWGLVEQAMRDRALQGIDLVKRRSCGDARARRY